MLWLPVLLPLLAAPLLGWLGARGMRRAAAATGAGALLATAWLAALATIRSTAGAWSGSLAWSESIRLHLDLADPISGLLAILVPAVAAAVVAYAAVHEERRGLGRLLALLTAFAGAMELLAAAADLLTLLIAWELVGACSWGLIGHAWREAEKGRAATTAFLVVRSGDLGLFVATAAAFAATGSFEYAALETLAGPLLHVVVAGIVAAAAAKSAQLPFSPWLFEAMEGPVSVSALLHSATMVASGAFLLARLHPALDRADWFGPATLALGLGTAIAAGLVALLQPHAKRLLAGSTSAHYGLMWVAVGAGYPAVAALHLLAHALFKAPIFLATGIAHRASGGYRLSGMHLSRALPWVAGGSAVATLALAGFPPLGGAWTKEEIAAAAGHHAPWAAILVAVAGALSAAYAARFQLQAFGRGPARAPTGEGAHPVARAAVLALAAATLALSVLWLPGARDLASRILGGEVPRVKTWEMVLSLALVGAGLLAGRAVAEHRPRLGEPGEAGHAAAAGWLGLPRLGRVLLVRPALRLATGLAAFDRRLDAVLPGSVARGGRALSRHLGGVDRRVVDGGVRGAAEFGIAVSRLLSRVDRRVVDRGVEAAAALAGWWARLSDRVGEWIFDGAPEGVSRATGRAGRAARKLQTGLAHHYYTLISVGLATALVLLVLFALTVPGG